MYHIKHDKRVYKSANLICDGLAEMLKVKSYDEISITDVCNINGIARTTFYRLFDTLDDVLYQFDNLFEQSINKYKKDSDLGKSYAKMIWYIFIFYKKKRKSTYTEYRSWNE